MTDWTNVFQQVVSIAERVLVSIYPADPGDDYVADDDGKIYAIGGVHDATYAVTGYWKSKKLDFGDRYENLKNHWKTIHKIQLKYQDLYDSTPITIYLSKDGVTWDYVTQTIGTGEEVVKVVDFHFRSKAQSTGRWFFIKVESTSASTSFEWHGMKIYFEPRGAYFDL